MKVRRTLVLIPVLLALLAAVGCDTLNHTQYIVGPAGAPTAGTTGVRATISSDDRAAVAEILTASAKRLRLEDRTKASLVPATIVYYLTPDESSPMKLFAWQSVRGIIIDFMHAPPTPGEDLTFRDEKDRLTEALQAKFGDRVRIVPFDQQLTPSTSKAP